LQSLQELAPDHLVGGGGGRCTAAKSPRNKMRLSSYGTEQTDFELLPDNPDNKAAWRVRKPQWPELERFFNRR